MQKEIDHELRVIRVYLWIAGGLLSISVALLFIAVGMKLAQ